MISWFKEIFTDSEEDNLYPHLKFDSISGSIKVDLEVYAKSEQFLKDIQAVKDFRIALINRNNSMILPGSKIVVLNWPNLPKKF